MQQKPDSLSLDDCLKISKLNLDFTLLATLNFIDIDMTLRCKSSVLTTELWISVLTKVREQ